MNIFKRKRGFALYAFNDAPDGGGDAPDGGGSANINIDLDNTTPLAGKDTPTEFKVPDAYKDKDYAKGLKSYDDVFKMLDGAQSKIGAKTIGIPTEKSSAEEIAAFNKAFGVPENIDDYDFTPSEATKALFGEDAHGDEDFTKEIKQAFHQNGLSVKQAKGVKEAYEASIGKVMERFKIANEENNRKFDELVKKTFGDKENDILETSKKLITEHAPEGFGDYINQLPNEALTVMAGVLNNIKEKYIDEDSLPGGDGIPSGSSPDTIRAEMNKILSSDAWKNMLHPQHSSEKARYWQLSGQLDTLNRNKK